MNEKANLSSRFVVHGSSLMALVVSLLFVAQAPLVAAACPFCLAIEPTLAQRRESAAAVALGEAADRADGGKSQPFYLHKVFKGPAALKKGGSIDAESSTAKTGELAILFATPDEKSNLADRWDWSTVFANEALLGYFAAAPDLRQPPATRLAYFAKYLEHADRDIARDAYLEFAHAPYEDVLTVSDRFDFAEVRRWLASPRVPDERKGFYGMVLGLARDHDDRAANRALLKRLIEADRSDFRAGFDGMLAGYLLLSGRDGLRLVTNRYVTDERARHGDVRHAMSALRFYYDYGPKELHDIVAQGVTPLIDRAEFAAAAIIDLARWQRWDSLDKVASIYGEPATDGPTKRAIVAYLKVCPESRAAAALDQLRQRDPAGVEALEKSLFLPAGK